MFGANQIVGQKYFTNESRLLVTSVFLTLQGEGPFAGRPALFVRLAKCNLNCSFCDTYFDSGDWLSLDDLMDKADRVVTNYYGPNPARRSKLVLVVTGGEPMLQANLAPMLQLARLRFAHTQIESNGILLLPIPTDTVLVVSPKCVEKHGRAIAYLTPNPKVLARADCLKFVLSADPTSPYHEIPAWAIEWMLRTKKQVYISPMNMYARPPVKAGADATLDQRSAIDEVVSFWEPGLLDAAQNQANHEYAARYCLRHGLTLSLQMHLYASVA